MPRRGGPGTGVSSSCGRRTTHGPTQALEDFGRAAGPGRYHVDESFPEPVAGHTSRRWGTVLKFPDGRVVLEPDRWRVRADWPGRAARTRPSARRSCDDRTGGMCCRDGFRRRSARNLRPAVCRYVVAMAPGIASPPIPQNRTTEPWICLKFA
jgi:hypothetical protein